jgi:putative intracellular protease/amidase
MAKVLCFIYDQMADFEVTLALHLIDTRSKLEVVTVGYEIAPIKSQAGFTYVPEMTVVDAANISGVEALIIPGGPISTQPPELTALIQKIHNEGKLIAAICFGPQYLGRAGILDHHPFTTSCSEEKIASLRVPDPYPRRNFINQRVVQDRNVITAQGRAFVDFAFAVSDYLHVFQDRAERDELWRDYKDL